MNKIFITFILASLGLKPKDEHIRKMGSTKDLTLEDQNNLKVFQGELDEVNKELTRMKQKLFELSKRAEAQQVKAWDYIHTKYPDTKEWNCSISPDMTKIGYVFPMELVNDLMNDKSSSNDHQSNSKYSELKQMLKDKLNIDIDDKEILN